MYTYIPTRIQISSQHTNCETIPKPYPLPGHSEMKLEMRYDLIDDVDLWSDDFVLHELWHELLKT